MISICLKSSNINLLNSLEQLLDKVSFERIYYSQRKFKIYNNLIIHYLGNDVNEFYNVFSDLISSFTINHFEKKFIQQQLNFDYFYFSADEKESIKSSAFNNLNQPINIQQKKNIIKNLIIKDLLNNKYKSFVDMMNRFSKEDDSVALSKDYKVNNLEYYKFCEMMENIENTFVRISSNSPYIYIVTNELAKVKEKCKEYGIIINEYQIDNNGIEILERF